MNDLSAAAPGMVKQSIQVIKVTHQTRVTFYVLSAHLSNVLLTLVSLFCSQSTLCRNKLKASVRSSAWHRVTPLWRSTEKCLVSTANQALPCLLWMALRGSGSQSGEPWRKQRQRAAMCLSVRKLRERARRNDTSCTRTMKIVWCCGLEGAKKMQQESFCWNKNMLVHLIDKQAWWNIHKTGRLLFSLVCSKLLLTF